MTDEQKKPNWFSEHILATMVLGILTLLLIAAVVNHAKSASYQAETTGFTVVDSAHISVSFRVKNTSKVAGTPTCTLKASGPSSLGVSGYYQGWDNFSLSSPIPAGQTINSADPLVINDHGAQYVNQTSISC